MGKKAKDTGLLAHPPQPIPLRGLAELLQHMEQRLRTELLEALALAQVARFVPPETLAWDGRFIVEHETPVNAGWGMRMASVLSGPPFPFPRAVVLAIQSEPLPLSTAGEGQPSVFRVATSWIGSWETPVWWWSSGDGVIPAGTVVATGVWIPYVVLQPAPDLGDRGGGDPATFL